MPKEQYCYIDRTTRDMHIISASSKSIAQWYVRTCYPLIRNPVFVDMLVFMYTPKNAQRHDADDVLQQNICDLEKDNTDYPELTVMKHLAQKV